MIITKKLAPQNALLLVMDPRTGEPPRDMGGDLVAATGTCVAVGTLPGVDGETTVEFSDEPGSPTGLAQVFDGTIATPSHEVHLCTTALESIARLPVSTSTARVRVWANHSTAPDHVLIEVGVVEETPPPGWPFADPPNVAVFTTADVVERGFPIVHVTHDEDDGAWQFHSVNGAPDDLKEHRLVALDEIWARDASVAELADLPFGWRALRESPGAAWRREPNPAESEDEVM